MTKYLRDPLYRRHRFPVEVTTHAVWLCFRFPFSLLMVQNMLAARGIIVIHPTIRNWVGKFVHQFASEIKRLSAGPFGDRWHPDECVITINGEKQWLWLTVDQNDFVIDVLVEPAKCRPAKWLMHKVLKAQGHALRVMITDKLRSCGWASQGFMSSIEHRSHKGLNNRTEDSYQPIRRRESIMKRFKSSRQIQRIVSIHDPIANLFHLPVSMPDPRYVCGAGICTDGSYDPR